MIIVIDYDYDYFCAEPLDGPVTVFIDSGLVRRIVNKMVEL